MLNAPEDVFSPTEGNFLPYRNFLRPFSYFHGRNFLTMSEFIRSYSYSQGRTTASVVCKAISRQSAENFSFFTVYSSKNPRSGENVPLCYCVHLDEGHPDGAHPRKRVDGLEALVH